MKKISFILTILCLLIMVNCQKKSTNEPPANNIHPQVDIPWPSLADTPWPIARGNAQCTARSSYEGPNLGIVEWIFSDSLFRNGTSAPVIGEDGTIYFTAEYDYKECRLYAIKSNGVLKWSITLDGACVSTPMIGAEDIIYVGCYGVFNAFYADATIKWQYCLSSPAYISNFSEGIGLDGTIYFSDSNGVLYALNPDGSLKWQTTGTNGFISDPYHSIAFSPDGNALYVVGLDTTLTALNSQSGSLIWQKNLNGNTAFRAPLVDNDGNIYYIKMVTSNDISSTTLVSVKPNGEIRWESEQRLYPFAPLHMDKRGNIYFKNGDSLSSIDYSGKTRWSKDTRIGDAKLSFYPIIGDSNGSIYMALTQGYILSFDHNGNRIFECEIPEAWTGIIPGAISKDGHLYVCGKYRLICIK